MSEGCICLSNLCCVVSAVIVPKILGYYICNYNYACSNPWYYSITDCTGRDACTCNYMLGCIIQATVWYSVCTYCQIRDSPEWVSNIDKFLECKNITTCADASCACLCNCLYMLFAPLKS